MVLWKVVRPEGQQENCLSEPRDCLDSLMLSAVFGSKLFPCCRLGKLGQRYSRQLSWYLHWPNL